MIDVGGFEFSVSDLGEAPRSFVSSGMSTRWFIACVCLQFVLMLAAAGRQLYTLNTGRVIEVQAQAHVVDESDILGTNCISLSYDVEQLLSSKADTFKGNEEVFVVLKRNDPFWIASNVVKTMPALTNDEVAVKARVCSHWRRRLNVSLGSVQIFLSKQKAAEVVRTGDTLSVRLAVDKSGTAAIRELHARDQLIDMR